MSSVAFSHTKTRERKYLAELLNEKRWFEREQFSVFLPQSMADSEKEFLEKNELLKRKIAHLQKAWRRIEADYFKVVKKFRHRKILPNYVCHISRFGPEGKYRCPNLLFIRLRTAHDTERALETIGHEFLHLMFANFFESKKLRYAEKEGLVDTLILESSLKKLFPQYEKQTIGKVRKGLLGLILNEPQLT